MISFSQFCGFAVTGAGLLCAPGRQIEPVCNPVVADRDRRVRALHDLDRIAGGEGQQAGERRQDQTSSATRATEPRRRRASAEARHAVCFVYDISSP